MGAALRADDARTVSQIPDCVNGTPNMGAALGADDVRAVSQIPGYTIKNPVGFKKLTVNFIIVKRKTI